MHRRCRTNRSVAFVRWRLCAPNPIHESALKRHIDWFSRFMAHLLPNPKSCALQCVSMGGHPAKCPFPRWRLDLRTSSTRFLGPRKSTSQTGSLAFPQFLDGSPASHIQEDSYIDHGTCDICRNVTHAMRSDGWLLLTYYTFNVLSFRRALWNIAKDFV